LPEKAKMLAESTSCCNSYGLLVGQPSSRQWQMMQRLHWSCWQSGVIQKWLVEK